MQLTSATIISGQTQVVNWDGTSVSRNDFIFCYHIRMTPTKKTGEFISGRFFSSIKYKAAKRNIPFDLTIEFLDELLIKQDHLCVYTGLPIDAKTRYATTASLDRIDSAKGYTEDNVQFLHKNINFMKWELPEEKFFGFIDMIYERRHNNNDLKVS